MKYAELKSTSGSHMIDDTYENFRLSWVQTARRSPVSVSGVHIEINDKGERVCTMPYLDHANGKTSIWPSGQPWPTMHAYAMSECRPHNFWDFKPRYYIGSPFAGLRVSEGFGGMVVRPMIGFFEGPRYIRKSKNGILVPHIVALASSMPNIVYTLMQCSNGINPRIDTNFPINYRVNLWQRASSVELPIYTRGTFSGNDVGYTEIERVSPYQAEVFGTSILKTKDNEKFNHWTFEQEAKLSTMLFAYGLEDSKIEDVRGEMIIKNEQGETIFNNRYDYMRILKYFPSINTLVLDGESLRNSPKRFSFPGRKIAVVALHPYCCVANGKGGHGYVFNTGFWFPDPSTVEFTSCASLLEGNPDGYNSVHPNFVKMAELINVMILDVTGCTPGWSFEITQGNGDPGVYVIL